MLEMVGAKKNSKNGFITHSTKLEDSISMVKITDLSERVEVFLSSMNYKRSIQRLK